MAIFALTFSSVEQWKLFIGFCCLLLCSLLKALFIVIPFLFIAFIIMIMNRLALVVALFVAPTAFAWVLPSNHQQQQRSLSRINHRQRSLSSSQLYSNVVLRPSENPQAFDSGKIGSARVHRYIRDNDSADAEYVMWYHGRSKEFPDDPNLPPLSTGRIGRATSNNGLVWEKCKEGSESEDVSDVSLGLNQESWWGFDTTHVGLGQVLLPMSTPAVMAEGGVYIMYYMGGDGKEMPISEYVENVETDATIKGMQMKIGVAVSQDGISWGRVEGDDPSGACMVPFDTDDPNHLSMFEQGRASSMDEELYCAWPEVVVHTDADIEVKPGQKKTAGFLMYYSTMRKSDKQKCLAIAASEDGFRWYKEGICVQPDETGLDAGGCARCTVIRNAEFDEESSTWKNTAGWTMYYEGVSKEDNKHRIMMAVSDDGIEWEKRGLAVDVGESEDTWDYGGVGSPHMLR